MVTQGDTWRHTGTHGDTRGHTVTQGDTWRHTGTHGDTGGHTGTHVGTRPAPRLSYLSYRATPLPSARPSFRPPPATDEQRDGVRGGVHGGPVLLPPQRHRPAAAGGGE
eukprot:1139995-Prorocentrum_minimum.AAC.1